MPAQKRPVSAEGVVGDNEVGPSQRTASFCFIQCLTGVHAVLFENTDDRISLCVIGNV